MFKFMILIAMLFSVTAQAEEMNYLQCDVAGKKDALLMMRNGREWGAFINRPGTGYVAADSCFSAKDAPEELLKSLDDATNLLAACVFITGDDGSGDAVVIRKGAKPQVEMLFVDINQVEARPSTVLNCY